MAFKVPEQYRLKDGPLASGSTSGNNGAFIIPCLDDCFGHSSKYFVIASNGLEWEHVSVSIKKNGEIVMPTWGDMCFIKDLFWDKEDCVMQLHPPESMYVNNVDYVLHLWRPIKKEIPMPFIGMV